MSRFSFSQALRTLGLAAVAVSPLVAGSAFADGFDGLGPSAYPAWTQTTSRTPLAARNNASPLSNPQQAFLLRSGATGGEGQGS
ncbi:hypothetical protein [Muricoccus nepalensis]|uniref:hypothetical protein n=1 Tax=Muricoccus nepalensis TaxID=1854500 RepID=UPI0013870F86|nr:hypothetical protein [Roseomonas nepalensis]